MRGRETWKWRHVGVVLRKELLDTTRDRRTWISMVIMPLLLVPILLLVMPAAMERQLERVHEASLQVAVVGTEQYPALVAFLGGLEGVRIVELEDPEKRLAAGDVHAILYLPDGMAAAVAREMPARIRLAFDATNEMSSTARERLAAALEVFSGQVIAGRLEKRGIDPAIVRPFPVSWENLAPPQRMAGLTLSMIMPLMLAMWASLGGMYAAIDCTAGEKERGTLEPLFSAPPSRTAMVTGKYLAVVITSVLASGISLAGMVVAYWIRPAALTGPGTGVAVRLGEILPAPAVGVIFLIALGLAGVFSALQLAISLYARSFREAQTYLSPLSFVVVLPMMVTQFLPIEQVPAWFFYVPVLNSLTVFRQVLLGIISPPHIMITLAISLAGIRLALAFAVSSFSKEQVLFRM